MASPDPLATGSPPMRDLIAFLPIDRYLALAGGAELPERVEGAGLFADISGFTPLTETLVRQLGPRRGAEELTARLNHTYDLLIDEVHRFGGTVVCFAGDAITCWFDGDDGRRATTCALAMQRALRAGDPAPGPVSIKVAVCRGSARRLLLGDPRIQLIDALAGPAVDALAATVAYAQRDEVVLDEATALGLAAETAWRHDGAAGTRVAVVAGLAAEAAPAPWPPPPAPPPESLLRPWALPAVRERLAAGNARLLAELRPATSLMLALGPLDLVADERASARLDAFVRWAQGVIHGQEGALIAVTMGDHGNFLHASFGAPLAHDEAAARAVAAALALSAPPPALGEWPAPRIGLGSGHMRCGPYGGASRRVYGVLGDRTNLAARLMDVAAPGEVVCDEATFAQARRRWAFAAAPPVRVKGKAMPVAIYRPTGAPGSDERAAAPLLGRDAELVLLDGLLAKVAAGGTSVLAIDGEAGIGKSRLLEELLRRGRERALDTLQGRGQRLDGSPYGAWRELLRGFLGRDGAPAPDDRAGWFALVKAAGAVLTPTMAERLGLLDDVLGLGLPAGAPPLAPSERPAALAELVAALLTAWCAARPLVLALEDAHLLDAPSWGLTLHVAHARIPGLLLAVALRPPEAGYPVRDHLAGLLGAPHARRMTLGALPDDATVAVAAARLGLPAQALPADLAALAHERAEGNPFFAEELVAALRDLGHLRVDGAGATARCLVVGELAAAARALPDTVQGLLLARIDRLPPDERETLRVAAVIGLTFAYAPLRHILAGQRDLDDDALRNQLRALGAKGLTWLESPAPDLAYRFKHVLTQEAAYQSLLFAQRRDLHRLVTDWYEATYGAQGPRAARAQGDSGWRENDLPLAPYVALLAHHCRHGEDSPRERRYAGLLGEQHYQISAFAAAAACFARALELTPPDEPGLGAERARLLRHLARAQLQLGDQGAAAAHLAASLALAEGDGDQAGGANACLELGALAARRGDHAGALTHLERGLALARAAGDRHAEARALDQLGAACTALGDEARALRYYQEAITLGRRGRRVNDHG